MTIFRPALTIDSIYNLNVADLKRRGINAVFSDLDNTLLAWNIEESAETMDELNQRLLAGGITLVVISNNNHARIQKVLAPYGIKFVARAKKPLPGGINKALRQFGFRREQTLMVGDQLLTDMIAGNLALTKTVLVKPLVETDAWNTSINRFFEKFIFFFLNMKRKITFKEYLN